MKKWNTVLSKITLLLGGFLLFAQCNKNEADAGPSPVADLIFQVEVANPRKVNFASTSRDAEYLIWDFGDGIGRAFGASASYEYATNGTYTVSLTASNKAGVSTKYAQISVQGPLPIDAAFTVNFTNVSTNLQVNLVNTSANAASYRWEFQDGTTSTATNPGTHTYAEPGLYEILLEALDAGGSVRDRQRIKVRVVDERDLFGSGTQRTWVFQPGSVSSRTGYYVLENGAVAYDNTLLSCELNDRYTFTAGKGFDNQNQGDGRLYSQGGQCRAVSVFAPSQWALKRKNLEQFDLEVGNNYLGDAESRATYALRTLTDALLSVSFERPNPLNNQSKDVVVMTFVPQ